MRRQLIDDKLEAVTPVVTLLADDASVWNVPSGNYTAVALAYDSIENPCKLYTQRFTNDPNDEYAPRSLEFEFYAPENNLNYSPYNTLIWQMQTANVAAMKYLCVKTAVADYLCEALGMTLEEVTASRGYDVPEEMIAQLNSPEGRGTSFSPLDEGSTYTLALLMYNSFGDTAFVSKSASTFGYFAKDFDRTKTLEDFIGAFGVTATVDVDSQSSEKTFRMDIARINDRDVLISGMTDMRDFAPQLKGYYDKELHMLIVEPQYAGMYNGAYATLGFSNGLSIFWGDAGMAVGYIGDTLYWASSPYSAEEVNSYMFLLFSTPQASSSSYLRQYAGSKTYSSLKMKPLQQASAQTAARGAESRTGSIETGGRRFTTYLTSERVAGSGEGRRKRRGDCESPGRRQASAHGPRAPHPLIRSPYNRKTGLPHWAEARFFGKIAKNGVTASQFGANLLILQVVTRKHKKLTILCLP